MRAPLPRPAPRVSRSQTFHSTDRERFERLAQHVYQPLPLSSPYPEPHQWSQFSKMKSTAKVHVDGVPPLIVTSLIGRAFAFDVPPDAPPTPAVPSELAADPPACSPSRRPHGVHAVSTISPPGLSFFPGAGSCDSTTLTGVSPTVIQRTLAFRPSCSTCVFAVVMPVPTSFG